MVLVFCPGSPPKSHALCDVYKKCTETLHYVLYEEILREKIYSQIKFCERYIHEICSCDFTLRSCVLFSIILYIL